MDEVIVHGVLSSPKNNYVASMNCDLKLLRDLNGHRDIFDDTKKLSHKSQLLLEKGPAYQNDIKNMKLYIGAPGTFTHVPEYPFHLSNAQIQSFSYSIDIMILKLLKIKDCSVYSPYSPFRKRRFNFGLEHRKVYHVGLGEFSDTTPSEFEYNHFMSNFDIWYQGKNQYFIFDRDLGKYIGSLGNYHFHINGRYQRTGKTIPDLNSFLNKYYWDFNPSHNCAIYHEDV